jgi:biotin transport system substrate-specific component
MMGPTGGYLVGFVAAAFMVGLLAERGWDRQLWTMAATMLAGDALLHIFGLLRLTAFIPSNSLLSVGLYPFIPGELIKIALVAITLPGAWKLLPRQRS